MSRELFFEWEWLLRAPPEALWPFLSDTNRLNRDMGVPAAYEVAPWGECSDFTRAYAATRFGRTITWKEEPFEWVRDQCFIVICHYRNAPFSGLRGYVSLHPEPEGTRVRYQAWLQPANAFYGVLMRLLGGVAGRRLLEKPLQRYEALALTSMSVPTFTYPVRFEPGGEALLEKLGDQLRTETGSPWTDALLQEVRERDDLYAQHIRPYELADRWQAPRREVLELCLEATRLGLLNLRWSLLCPLCRGSLGHERLQDVAANRHCGSCRIDFSVNFDESVEITFYPNPAIRHVPLLSYCRGAPQRTPHVVCQQMLAPGEERVLTLSMPPGGYRLRTADGNYTALWNVPERTETDDPPAIRWTLSAEGWQCRDESGFGTVLLYNATGERQLFVLEESAWSDQIVTAAHVTSLQKFRDLFSSEALRPDEQINVGRLTVLFTDLKDSTALYQRIGDAPAFGSVMSHFDVVKDVIQQEEGAIVKTMGDAVMAVFTRPVAAVRAVIHIQRLLSDTPLHGQRFKLKAGIHTGPCIAVTLNDRLDYFGSTVNIAARLQALSAGNDLVISDDVHQDAEVYAFLAENAAQFQLFARQRQLKGFEDREFKVWQLVRDERTASREAGPALSSEAI